MTNNNYIIILVFKAVFRLYLPLGQTQISLELIFLIGYCEYKQKNTAIKIFTNYFSLIILTKMVLRHPKVSIHFQKDKNRRKMSERDKGANNDVI